MDYVVLLDSEILTLKMQSTHIIIVNYNADDWLSRALVSALQFSDGEVSVVDNASSDNSVELAKKQLRESENAGRWASRTNWILNKQNVGFAAANNQVLKTIDNQIAVLMNPDCELNQQTLPTMLEALEQRSEFGLLSCQIVNQDGSVQTTSRRRFPTPWSALVRMLMLHKLFPNNPKFSNFDYGDAEYTDDVEVVEAVSGAFMMVRPEALAEVGLLDQEYFMHCEDLDWCKRFEQQGWKVGSVKNANLIHAKGVSSQHRKVAVLWTLHKGMDRFFNKFHSDEPLLLRLLVKLGIYFSFVLRAILASLQKILNGSK